MASAKTGVHVVQLKPISVPKNLIDGCKFVKWDDVSTVNLIFRIYFNCFNLITGLGYWIWRSSSFKSRS